MFCSCFDKTNKTKNIIKEEVLDLNIDIKKTKPQIVNEDLDFDIKYNKCCINSILNIESNFNKLNYQDIYRFLFSFSSNCENNVEFSEFSNEVLFKLFVNFPIETIDVISKSYSYIEIDIVLDIIKSPLLDYNLDIIIDTISNYSNQTFIIKEIVNSLNIANQSY